MNRHSNRQTGFAPVVILLVIIAGLVISALVYTLYGRLNQQSDGQVDQSSAGSKPEEAPEIETLSDLNSAETALDQADASGDSELSDADALSSEF